MLKSQNLIFFKVHIFCLPVHLMVPQICIYFKCIYYLSSSLTEYKDSSNTWHDIFTFQIHGLSATQKRGWYLDNPLIRWVMMHFQLPKEKEKNLIRQLLYFTYVHPHEGTEQLGTESKAACHIFLYSMHLIFLIPNGCFSFHHHFV